MLHSRELAAIELRASRAYLETIRNDKSAAGVVEAQVWAEQKMVALVSRDEDGVAFQVR